jgi:hypothetical protein
VTKFIATLPPWLVFLAISIPGMLISPSNMLLGLSPYFVWLYSLGAEAHGLLPLEQRIPFQRFAAALLFSICCTVISEMSSNTIMPDAAPFNLVAMFCIFYCLYYIARSLRTAELNRKTKFKDWFVIFLGLWFFPIGVWFIQRKIRRLL